VSSRMSGPSWPIRANARDANAAVASASLWNSAR
jgi:hypothetical protein